MGDPPHGSGPIRVLLADDHTMFRQGLAGVLASYRSMEVVAEVLENHPDAFDPFRLLRAIPGIESGKPFVWLEHYQAGARGTPEDPATFDLVKFSHYEPRAVLRAGVWSKEIGTPIWKPLDRATVETLIGEPLAEG